MDFKSIVDLCSAKEITRGNFLGHCPAHDDKKPSLSIKDQNGKVLLHCFSGCEYSSILEALDLSSPEHSVSFGSNESGNKLEKIIQRSKSALDTISAEYIVNRGLDSRNLPESVLHVDELIYYDQKDNIGTFPALIAVITDKNDKTFGVQAIYLNKDGRKANVPNPKKVFGKTKGLSVKLGELNGSLLHLCEGLETGLAIYQALHEPVRAVLSANNLDSQAFPEAINEIHIWEDCDRSETGRIQSERAALFYRTKGYKVVIHRIQSEIPKEKKGIDWLDIFVEKGPDLIQIERNKVTSDAKEWNEPVAIEKNKSFKAPALTDDMLPSINREFIKRTALSLGVPLDFIAIPYIVCISSLIGKKVKIAPRGLENSWRVVPNLWGMIVGRPSSKKSPSLKSITKFMQVLEQQITDAHSDQLFRLQAEYDLLEQKILDLKKSSKDDQSGGHSPDNTNELCSLYAERKRLEDELEPFRLMTSSATIEKMQEILAKNTNGILVLRDELSGFISEFDKKGHEADREFYLEGWNGDGTFISDTISRGTTKISELCISILGTTQPGKLAKIVSGAKQGSLGADGFIQRFQMLVFPDKETFQPSEPIIVENRLEENVLRLFKSLNELEHQKDVLLFDGDAQRMFERWVFEFEQRIASELFENEAIEEHLGKYSKLVVSLSAIFHIISNTERNFKIGRIDLSSLNLALYWVAYLEGNAKKVYCDVPGEISEVAQKLIKRIKSNQIYDSMSLRELFRKGWSETMDHVAREEALNILERHNYIRLEKTKSISIGRSSTVIRVNPLLNKGERGCKK
jgi:hypothetical protein